MIQQEGGRIMLTNEQLDGIVKKYKAVTAKGKVADYIPELAMVDPQYLGVAVVDSKGKIFNAGDDNIYFAIESISKTVVLALALLDNGEEEVFKHMHKEPSGDPFNSIKKLETESDHLPRNPFINAGAIMTASLIKGNNPDEKFQRILDFMKKISEDDSISLDTHVYLSEKQTGDTNRGLAYYMKGQGVMPHGVIEDVLDVYFRQCSIKVTVVTLAKIARFFAAGGVLTTGERVISERYAEIVSRLITTCGMYDQSGEFITDVGMPGKSGVGGGIICPIAEKNMGIAVFGPALDAEGNSIAGIEVLKEISSQMKLDIF